MDKWNHRITEVVRDILTPKNGDQAISFRLLISYFFLVPLLKGVWPPLPWQKYFLTSCSLFLVPSPYILGSVCLCLSIPACEGDGCRPQEALPLACSSWGRTNSPPSTSPLRSLAPLCQLRCWGAQKWTWYSRCCLTSAKRKGRTISAAFQVQLAIFADSCSALCLPGPPCLSPQRLPADIWCQHGGLSGVTLAQMWYYCPCWTSQIFYQIIFQPVPLSSSPALCSIRHSPTLLLFMHLLNRLSHHPGNSLVDSYQSQRNTAGSQLPSELCTHYQHLQAQQPGSFSAHLFVHLLSPYFSMKLKEGRSCQGPCWSWGAQHPLLSFFKNSIISS